VVTLRERSSDSGLHPIRPAGPGAEVELLDRPDLGFTETERALAGLARVNRVLFGHGALARTLAPRIAAGPSRQRLLDVGTGTGEAPARLARSAGGPGFLVVGVDRKVSHLVIGRRAGHRQLRAAADAGALPFRDGAFDWAASTLLFHHFDAAGNRRILAEMRRVAARVAVVDLRRSRPARWLAALLFPLLRLCPITRHDGFCSLARSWPLGAVAEFAAPLPVEELRPRFPFRFSLVVTGGRPPGVS
jgi:SAM-dependent methyltransferase